MQRAADPLAFRFERWMLDRERGRREGDGRLLVIRCTDGFGGLSFGVAYDETDEILLPPGHQSEAWKARAQGTELGCDRWCAERIRGHYYRWMLS
jgi:hypothetical protein